MSQCLLALVLGMVLLGTPRAYARESKAEAMVADLLGQTNLPAEDVDQPVLLPDTAGAPPDVAVPVETEPLPEPAPEPLPEPAPEPLAPPPPEPAAPVIEPAAVGLDEPPLGPPPVIEDEVEPAAPRVASEPELAAPPFDEIVTETVETTVETIEGGQPGTVVGRVSNHRGRPLPKVKMVLFNDQSYREMFSTPRGNYGFSVTSSAEYVLTATFGNQFFFTNLFLEPGLASLVQVRFSTPINVYGRLTIDGLPAMQGLFLRCIHAQGAQAGGIVVSNGYFTIKNLTPGAYTMVFERRKRFIDDRINESRFYYVPVVLTSDTARIIVERDRRRVKGRVIIDGLRQRHVDAVIALKDAPTNGRLIHREMYSYYQEGYFIFEHVPPGAYTLQATQSQREWKSAAIPVYVDPEDRIVQVTIDVSPDPDRRAKERLNLIRQFGRD